MPDALEKLIDRARYAAGSPRAFLRLLHAIAANRLHHWTAGLGARRVRCNLCGWEGRHFDYFLERQFVDRDSQCPGCGTQRRNRELIAFIERALPPAGKRILDIAPAARYQEWFTTRGADYVSIDYGRRTAMARMDVRRLAFPDECFDLIVCSHVLEHVPDYPAALHEIRRVLAPSGLALLSVPFHRGPRSQRLDQPDHQGHFHLFGQDIKDKIAAAGLRVEVKNYSADRDPAEPSNQFFAARPA